MIKEKVLQLMVRAINEQPELRGCIIGYYGNRQCRTLDRGDPPTGPIGVRALTNYDKVAVIIEEIDVADAPTQDDTKRRADAPHDPPTPPFISNRSVIKSEKRGRLISCATAVVSGALMVGGAAAELPSGGTSTALVVLGWIGFAASAAECVNGIVRVQEAESNPSDNSLQRWNDNKYYANTMLVIDIIALGTAVASLPAAGKNLFAVLARSRAFVAKGVTEASLRTMTAAEREALVAQAFLEASRNPAALEELTQASQAAGLSPTLVKAGEEGMSVEMASKLTDVIKQATIKRLLTQTATVVNTGIGGAANAQDWTEAGSASGVINVVINIVTAGDPEK